MYTHKMDPHDYSPPPPAYNDEEFDRKTSLATEASLQHAPPQSDEISEERWAEIEEAAFQAAIAASLAEAEAKGSHIPSEGQSSRNIEPGPPSPSRSRSPGAGSSSVRRLATIKPLRIEKKGKTSVDLKNEKDKPKWFAESESHGGTSSSALPGSSAASHGRHDSYDAPPPFVEVAPAGSEYNEPNFHDIGFDSLDCAGPTSVTPPVPSSEPSPDSLGHGLGALSLSSFSSPASDHQPTAHPYQPPAHPLPQPPVKSHVQCQPSPVASNGHRQSMPVSPSQELEVHRVELHRSRSFTPQPSYHNRPTTPQGRGAMNAPMMAFNPSVAYGKSPFARLQTPPLGGMEEPKQGIVYRANAFYNAAVSAHLTPQTPQRSVASDQRSAYSSQSLSYNTSYDSSYSTASSPGYGNTSHTGMGQHPYTAAPTPTDPNWGRPYPGSNRPLSVYSTNSAYSTNSVGQPQYLNTFQQVPGQHSGGPPSSWATAGSQQYQGQWQ